MTSKDWPEYIKLLNTRMGALRQGHPEIMAAFHQTDKAATTPGALDSKTKELIALAIGITARCDGCLAYHARAAAKYGATRPEVLETIAVAIYMGGGPAAIYGSEALEAFDALSPKPK